MEGRLIINKEINNLSELDKLKLYRFQYKIGQPLLNDVEYDKFESSLNKEDEEVAIYLNRVWEDDPIPLSVLKRVYSTEDLKQIIKENDLEDALNFTSSTEFKATSIEPYRTMQGAYEWLCAHRNIELILTPKADGNSTSTEYIEGKYVGTRTRGRGGGDKFIDISPNCSKVLPQFINFTNLTINAEEYVEPQDIHLFSEFANIKFTSPRACGISAMRREEYPEELKKKIKLRVFNASYGDKLSDGLDKAKELGFLTMPYWLHKFRFSNYSEFTEEVTQITSEIKEFAELHNIPTDGVVFQVNDKREFLEYKEFGKYTAGNMAFKALFWEPGVYVSVVQELMIEKSGKSLGNYCVKALVRPVQTESGKTLQTVSLYNLANCISNKIHVGSIIKFRHLNDTTNEFLSKEGELSMSAQFKVFEQGIAEKLSVITNDKKYHNYEFLNSFIENVAVCLSKLSSNPSEVLVIKNKMRDAIFAIANKDEEINSICDTLLTQISLAFGSIVSIDTPTMQRDAFMNKLCYHPHNFDSYQVDTIRETNLVTMRSAISYVLDFWNIFHRDDVISAMKFEIGKEIFYRISNGTHEHPVQFNDRIKICEMLGYVNLNDSEDFQRFISECKDECPAFKTYDYDDALIRETADTILRQVLYPNNHGDIEIEKAREILEQRKKDMSGEKENEASLSKQSNIFGGE